ncbi:homoserine dehydrogenase [Halanaerobium sp. ST460_2HS_T2]|uniref:homoserine dehydrogenase n=1 Tax=Halanaerobium sp. ST460_2HS_T2 TaxID=2183914 RepID=UPI000DF44984|nr:homoserine dehydrogenase [Halanaerobium sp. ST460_2HS_T2]RCW55686.1 homoserine dehydrogenase [Halanaerobium sp. ST460_2HS_T2]
MIKLALIANQKESLELFLNFFNKNKTKIEKLSSQKLEIKYIYDDSDQNKIEYFLAASLNKIELIKDYQSLINTAEIDIIIELERKFNSADYLLQALKNKKIVITSNHKVLAENYLILKKAEAEFNTKLFFSASFSPLPVKTLIDNFYALDEVTEINAVLNATTNYILSEMGKNTVSMKETVEQAKEASYTEDNPELDLSGSDSLNKSILMTELIFNKAFDFSAVSSRGIKGITSYDLIYAAELGYKIKLICTIKKEKGKLYLGVRPNLISEDSFLADVNENSNGIEIISNYNSKVIFKAENNDLAPLNLLSQDLIKAARIRGGYDKVLLEEPGLNENKLIDLYQHQENSFYVRLQLEKDKKIIENIKKIFSEKNLADLILHDDLTETPLLPVIIITKKIKEKVLEKLLKEVENVEGVLTVNNVIAVKTH